MENQERVKKPLDSGINLRLLVCRSTYHNMDKVGCTCLIGRFCYCRWGDTRTWEPLTCGSAVPPIDYMRRNVLLNDRLVRLQVSDFDSYGQLYREPFHKQASGNMSRVSFSRSSGVVFVYSVVDKHSWEQIKGFIEEVKKNDLLSELSSAGYTVTAAKALLVGTKCDLIVTGKREVDYDTAKEFADANGMLFFEVSAKDGTNVELAFMTLVADTLEPVKSIPQCSSDDKKSCSIL